MQQPTAAVLDFRPGADMIWEIIRTDDVFETINTVAAHTGGPPVHMHPHAEESYEVLEGVLEVFLDGAWRTLGPGDKLVVPPGAAHTVRGHSDLPAKIVNIHRPALEYEAFFRQFHRLVSTGAVKLPPKDPGSLLYFGLLFSAYPELQRTVKPPQSVFNLLARLGRTLGLGLDGA
jgi:quercetin dioxygenase-like cupin family protein